MILERTGGVSTTQPLIKPDTEQFLAFDWHSIALNHQETNLLFVGHHELAFINVENLIPPVENSIRDETNLISSLISGITLVPLFDASNVNRPVVQWNPIDSNQYAVAIDRLVRFYTVDHACIQETHTIIDSQHQRPITTIAYSPNDSHRFLTGSLDGQIQVWDTRVCSSRTPANLKFNESTPFPIRSIRWCPVRPDLDNQLAVQCDRCIRIYDIRRAESPIASTVDLEHSSRIVSMDWTAHSRSIVSLSVDQSIRIYSTDGQVLAESFSNEASMFASKKICATNYDNLFICSTRETRDGVSSTSGYFGWIVDDDKCLKPMTNRIVSTTPSPIVDFCLVTRAPLLNLVSSIPSAHLHESMANRFVLLTWCRDRQLCLVQMDPLFQQVWHDQHLRMKISNSSDESSSNNANRISSTLFRPYGGRSSLSMIPPMDAIKDEGLDDLGMMSDENCFEAMSTSPSNTIESPETDEDVDDQTMRDTSNNTTNEITIENELNAVRDNYGPHIAVECKDPQRRMCTLRCICSLDGSKSFRMQLILSRYYPTISQLFVRFKISSNNLDQRIQAFQSRIQLMFDQTSQHYFYCGRLCLHPCLLKLKSLFDSYFKQEKRLSTMSMSSTSTTNRTRDISRNNSELESSSGLPTGNAHAATNGNSNRILAGSSSSTRTSDSQSSSLSFAQANRRTCGARFSGTTHLICFGRVSKSQASAAAQILAGSSDTIINRGQSAPTRSTSLTGIKIRESSNTDEPGSYRSTTTSTVQIQSIGNSQRMTMYSASVRSSVPAVVYNDYSRISTPFSRSMGHLSTPHSNVSIYDVSILLPVSKKLADDYRIDLQNPLDMCKENQLLTTKMAKTDLAHCWRLLGGLINLQSQLNPDNSWFQSPIAQGLVKHLVSSYVENGDIQSASMFLLAMSETPYLKTNIESKLVNEHDFDPVLYTYASLLHRWRHFYRRTQILSKIDHNCQSPAPSNLNPSALIKCAICCQPVVGQYFVCAVCNHGGHLPHMHQWFASEDHKRRLCPEKDCNCLCMLKQQDLLVLNTAHMQQQSTILSGSRPHFARQLSGGIRPM